MIELILSIPLLLFLLEHFGRIYNVSIIRTTTYINQLTKLFGTCWYYLGFCVASVASFLYELYKRFWEYFKELKATVSELWNSIVLLFETPKQFIVGFYERAAKFLIEYIKICLFIATVLINILVYHASDTICYYVSYKDCSWISNLTFTNCICFISFIIIFIIHHDHKHREMMENSNMKFNRKTYKKVEKQYLEPDDEFDEEVEDK